MAVLGVQTCLALTSQQVQTSINRTIDAVEKMTREDPTLPRISRAQILDILRNVTSGHLELANLEKMTKDTFQKMSSTVQNEDHVPDSAEAVIELGKHEEIVFPPYPQNPSPFAEKIETAASTIVECKNRSHRHAEPKSETLFSFPDEKRDQEPERFSLNLSDLEEKKPNFLPTIPSMPVNMKTMFEIPRKTKASSSYKHPSPIYVTPSELSTSDGLAIDTNIITKPADLLESIGVRPPTDDINITKNMLRNDPPKSTRRPTESSTTPQVSYKNVDNLSSDVRLLFQKFGLPLPDEASTTSTTRRPTTTFSYLDSFTNFKRLPTSRVEDDEMKEFLARFGLGSDTRNRKSLTPKMDNFGNDVSFDIRKALENVGLVALAPRVDLGMGQSNVFKPHEATGGSEEQKQKIRKLLDTVKMVQEGGVQDVDKVVNDLVQTTKALKSGPDPVGLEQVLELYHEDLESEKRQRQAVFNETKVLDETTTGT